MDVNEFASDEKEAKTVENIDGFQLMPYQSRAKCLEHSMSA